MESSPILELVYDEFKTALPTPPDGRELTPYELKKFSFIEGFKLGLQMASEAFITW